MHLWDAMSLWHTDVCIYLCIWVGGYLSVYPSTFRKCFSSNMPWWIFVILGYNNHQVGVDNTGVQDFGVKGHLGVIWDHWSNMLKMLLRLHYSIDFDETWVKRSLAGGSVGVFRGFWSEDILGSFGVTVRSNFKQPSTTKLTMSVCWSRSTTEKHSWWPLHLTCG